MRARCAEPAPRPALWLGLAVLLAYFNAFWGDFQFDDYKVIVDNPRVHSWASWAEGLSLGIRPLLKFSYTLDWTLGLGAAGFHLTNLLVHFANAWLVFHLCILLTGQQAQRASLQAAPLLAALLFAVHPVHTEAVTYICGRSSALMTLFYLGGLLAYATGRARQDKVLLYALVPLLFVAALAVKETAVTFPLALLLWELACGGTWRTVLRAQWPSWAVLFAGALFFLANDAYLSQIERSAGFNTLQGNLANQLTAFAWLMRQWALPLWLNIDPDLPLRQELSASLPPALFFVAAVVLMLACCRKRPWITFALAWAIIHLLPLHLFLPRLDIANERQLYLASWPLFLALAVEMRLRLNERVFRLAAAILVMALAALTLARNHVYDNEIALWEDTARKSPNKARVHNNLGYAYKLAGRTEDARSEFTLALQLDHADIKARYNLRYLEDPPL